MNKEDAIRLLVKHPAKFGRMVGFTKLSDFHNEWMIRMISGKGDETLQAHRGSYKTTCVSLALAIICVLHPTERILFIRKTDDDVKEVIAQVKKILMTPHMKYIVASIYGIDLELTKDTSNEASTNLNIDIRGASQIMGLGLGSSLTGKHFERIFTDDIVNLNDRLSKAERERTKLAYMELHNLKNAGGRIFNTGTPWHKEDAFTIMPRPTKYDVYTLGMLSNEEIQQLRDSMAPSLFAANYELRHIASEDVIFPNPVRGGSIDMVKGGLMHVDSAFYGEDFTAMSVMTYHDGKYYLYGKLWRKHVEDCYKRIESCYIGLDCVKMFMETNADKGMVARDLRKMGMRVSTYAEGTNKYIKIVTYLKAIWKDVIFVDGTDPEYIEQIESYTDTAEHDDAPDSASCLARILYKKDKETYVPLWNGERKKSNEELSRLVGNWR